MDSAEESTKEQVAEIRREVKKNTQVIEHVKEKTYSILDKVGFLSMKIDELKT
jgi:hypothetical protein